MITHISAAGEEDVELAVQAARAAFTPGSKWRSISPAERGKLLWKVADLVERDQHILATIDAWDNGKPYQVALEEDVGEVIGVLRYYAGWADKVQGKTIDTGNAKLAYTKHEPVGELANSPSSTCVKSLSPMVSVRKSNLNQVSVDRLSRGIIQ